MEPMDLDESFLAKKEERSPIFVETLNTEDSELFPERPKRTRRQPNRFGDWICNITAHTSKSVEETERAGTVGRTASTPTKLNKEINGVEGRTVVLYRCTLIH